MLQAKKLIVAFPLITAALVASVGYVAYRQGHQQGNAEGVQSALASVKATCDDEAAPTVLGGTPYMCVSKPQWNKVMEYVFQQGALAGYKKGKGET